MAATSEKQSTAARAAGECRPGRLLPEWARSAGDRYEVEPPRIERGSRHNHERRGFTCVASERLGSGASEAGSLRIHTTLHYGRPVGWSQPGRGSLSCRPHHPPGSGGGRHCRSGSESQLFVGICLSPPGISEAQAELLGTRIRPIRRRSKPFGPGRNSTYSAGPPPAGKGTTQEV